MSELEEWSRKLGIPVETLERKVADLEKYFADLPEPARRRRAILAMRAKLLPYLRSKAVAFEGLILGYSDKRDILGPKKRRILEQAREDMERAITLGLVDPTTHEPLDKETGRPIGELWVKDVYALTRPYAMDETPKLTLLQLRGDKVDEELQVGVVYRFRALLASDNGLRQLRSAVVTSFTKIRIVDPIEYLDMIGDEWKSDIDGLTDWHDDHADDFNRVVFIEGEISYIREEPTKFGSTFFMLSSEESEEPLPCFARKDLEVPPVGSGVIVLGRTRYGFDPATGERNRIQLNVFGILERFKIPEKALKDIDEMI